MSRLLVFCTEVECPSADHLVSDAETIEATFVAADPDAIVAPLPSSWQHLRTSELLDNSQLGPDVIRFLARWPSEPSSSGATFDGLFRREGGYSVWWTGPALERNPERSVFPKLRKIWLFDRALGTSNPDRVVIHTRDSSLAVALASRCRRAGIDCRFVADSSPPAQPWKGRIEWVAGALVWLLVNPLLLALRAILARWATRSVQQPPRDRGAPVVLLTGLFPRDLSHADPPIDFFCWRNVPQALRRAIPGVQIKYLVQSDATPRHGFRPITPYYHTGWRWLAGVSDVAPLSERYVCIGAWLAAAARQLVLMARWWRLERDVPYRDTFQFAGADVSALFVPLIRRRLARAAGWPRLVAVTERSIRAAGNVRALLVEDEFYERGMIIIAAARRAGIPTVGVQHGTSYPMHLKYTMPPEEVKGAPMPDYFAAYGEYGRQIVSRLGAYPYDRVWLSGAARFDHLAAMRVDVSAARLGLGLPDDRRIILVTTQIYPWFPRAVSAVLKAAKDHPDWLVCIKTHPINDSPEIYRALAAQLGAENVRLFDRGFEDLLAACDVLVGASSTTVLEAILLGKPTLCMNFTDEADWFPYVADGGSLSGRSDEEVAMNLARCLNPAAQSELAAARARFLVKHLGPAAEGRAAQTLAEQVASLCGKVEILPAAVESCVLPASAGA
jgi:hypothetical protein